MPKQNNEEKIGERYGRLVIVEYSGIDINGNKYFLCKCDCGNEKEVAYGKMRSGHTKSCGCYNRDINKEVHKTHGLSGKRIYNIWRRMVSRCGDKNDIAYKDYGGRGIGVCDEWKKVEVFYKWAMENGYKKDLEIDRIDNNKGYYPENCRWATHVQQSRNRRSNILVTVNGETKVLADWAERFGLCYNTVLYRYYRGDRGKELFREKRSPRKIS